MIYFCKEDSKSAGVTKKTHKEMKELALDFVLVPLGVGLFGLYHLWLLYTIAQNPRRTVIGLNAESRHQWVFYMMAVSFSSTATLSICLSIMVYVNLFWC